MRGDGRERERGEGERERVGGRVGWDERIVQGGRG